MRFTARLLAVGAAATLASGCTSAVPIGSELRLDYGGDHRDVVTACARDVPSTISSPLGYPGSAVVSNVTVTARQVSDALARFDVTGEIELEYGRDTLTYEWHCEASARHTIVKVSEVDSELRGSLWD